MSTAGISPLEYRELFSFGPPVAFPIDFGSVAMAGGDFNGDGRLDLAVANVDTTLTASDSVSVLLANGDGTFQPATTWPVGDGNDQPSSIAVGDFNGDGRLDIVTANRASGTLSVLLGNGDGTFQAPRTVYTSADNELTSVAVGDFDRDGTLDLAVADAAHGRIGILLGRGDGTFQPPAYYSTGAFSQPVSIAVGKLDHAGRLDLVVGVNESGANGGSLSRDEIFLGRGDGTFEPPAGYLVGQSISQVAVGRFGGRALDLVNADPVDNQVRVLLGNGDGTFQPPLASATGEWPVGLAVGDFNGDGELDVATTNLKSSSVSVLLGRGDGTFAAPVDHPVGSPPHAVVAGDFNSDGLDDLAVADEQLHARLFVSPSDSQQRFVGNLYRVLLHRPADAAGLAFWSHLLGAGTRRGAVALAIETSLEYRAAQVEQLYGRYLHRAADPAGLNYFVRFLEQGGTVEQVAASLAGSPEATASWAAGSSGGDAAFVDYAYQAASGRAPAAQTLETLSGLLDGGAGRSQVAAEALAGPQYRTALVDGFYRQFLGRAADLGGLDFELRALARGASDEQAAATILASNEFFARAGIA